HQRPRADHRRDREAVAERLAEAGEVRNDAEALLRPAARPAEPGDDLVPDEDRAVTVRQVAHAGEEAFLRLLGAVLEDDRGVFARVLVEQRGQRLQPAVGEGADQVGPAGGDAGGPRRGAGEPVVPAVVAAGSDPGATGVGARQADGGGGGVGAVL